MPRHGISGSFFIYYYSLCFEVCFVSYEYCYPSFFLLFVSVFMKYLSLLLLFSICVCLSVWSPMEAAYIRVMFFFFIHPVTICFFNGALSHFTFKVIIDGYVLSPFKFFHIRSISGQPFLLYFLVLLLRFFLNIFTYF